MKATRQSDAVFQTTAFLPALGHNIRRKVDELKAEGITGMTIDNLRMVVKSPPNYLSGAPRGTNAQFLYAELFREAALAIVPKFLIP